jgi:phosphoserine phosphatase RsbU/P
LSNNTNILNLKHLELDTLLDISNAINQKYDEASLLKIYLFTLVANFKIRRLFVCAKDIGGWVETMRHGLDADFKYEVSDLKVMEKNFEFLYLKQSEFGNFSAFFDVAIPVGRQNKVVAWVFIGGSKRIVDEGGEESLKFIQTISNIILVAVQNLRLNQRKFEQQAIKKEMELARKLQFQLFPENLPDQPNLKIQATYLPHLEVGGDYYDYIKLNDNEFIICVADVSGKGVAAAIIMSNIQAAIRILVKQKLRLKEIVSEINELVFQNTKGEKFVTFFIAHYHLEHSFLEYINCGHNAPLFFDKNRKFTELDKGTMILGAFKDLPSIESGIIRNTKNALLFAYTDGLVEGLDKPNTEDVVEKIKSIIYNNKEISHLHNEILFGVYNKNFSMDDITLLSCFTLN